MNAQFRKYTVSLIDLLKGDFNAGESGAKPDGWRSGPDLRKMYESVTPNPTGSLSGPYFLQDTGGTVTGTGGAQIQVHRGTATGTESTGTRLT